MGRDPKVCLSAYIFTPFFYSYTSLGQLWPEPETFRPERWLNVAQPSAFKYVVFNAGPRLCLGKPLAYMEIKLMLAMILARFTFTFHGTPDDSYTSTLVLPMQNGLSLKFQKRN
jgi:cytochrome P450